MTARTRAAPSSVTPRGLESRTENLFHTLTIAAWLGILSGFIEGVIDLTAGHIHAPAILCVTLLADTGLFVILGLGLWLLARALGQNLPAALSYLFFGLLGSWCVSGFEWILALGAFVLLLPVAAWAHTDNQFVRRVGQQALRWSAVAALACLVAIPAEGRWAEWQATKSLPGISANAPNVLWIVMDTVRADHLSCYGYPRDTSPNLGRLARQGTLFEHAIAAASWTLPSHATMMTGTYPDVHHTDTGAAQLPSSLPTIAGVLRNDGYRTGAFSANIYLFDRQHGFGRGFLHFGDFFQSPTDALDRVRYVNAIDNFLLRRGWAHNFLGRQTAAEINRAALGWLGESGRPFFLVLNYLDAHDPYVPPQPWRHMFSRHRDPGGPLDIGINYLPKLTSAQIRSEMEAYDGGIAYEDHEIQKLLDSLRRRGLLQNTLVIVTSDHGEAFGGHGFFDHANALYYPQIHVPLIFWWPGHVPEGVRVSQPISTKDIGATILALLGKPQGKFPGESLSALWTGKARPESWPVPISELAKLSISPTFPDEYGPLRSAVGPELQYISDPRLGALLFNWKTDPEEKQNLAGNPAYGGEITVLRQEFRQSRQLARTVVSEEPMATLRR